GAPHQRAGADFLVGQLRVLMNPAANVHHPVLHLLRFVQQLPHSRPSSRSGRGSRLAIFSSRRRGSPSSPREREGRSECLSFSPSPGGSGMRISESPWTSTATC